jgi:multidrug efflux pump subunit AcrA (membrane-fusion protein)
MQRLVASKKAAGVAPKVINTTLVEIVEARAERRMITVEAMGSVIPSRELDLYSEVGGRIVEMNPNLVPGGFLTAGDLIVRIDPRDYEVAVSQAEAMVEKARLGLEVELGRQVVAKREWDAVFPTTQSSEASSRLALREPHLLSAEAGLKSAKSALMQARLNLERTVISAPFNAIARNESVEIGELVTPQSHLATLVGTDRYWVQVSVPVSRLAWIEMPDRDGLGGARAGVFQQVGQIGQVGPDAAIEREGLIIRLLSDLEPDGRMARLLVAVDNPLGLKSSPKSSGNGAQGVPLLIGSYVRVEIEGREIEKAFAVPRRAVREGNRLWVMDEEDRLAVRDVEIIWSRKDDVLLANHIQPGERIITSRISTPIPGMLLRIDNGEEDPEEKPDEKPVDESPAEE